MVEEEMKMFRVMAMVNFDYRGNKKEAGQIFDMSSEDYTYWGGFVKHVPRDMGKKVQPTTKPAPRARRKDTGGTVK